MTNKQKIITGYALIAIIYTLYSWIWGAYSYRGFAYNLGRGICWPATILPGLGHLIGGLIWIIAIVAILFLTSKNKDLDKTQKRNEKH